MPSSVEKKKATFEQSSDTRPVPRMGANYTMIEILSVMPGADDQDALDKILMRPHWNMHKAASFSSALEQLTKKRVPLVLCEERDLRGATWKDLLTHTRDMTAPPFLVVASRMADEHLWAEALNLGAYDVLATPFEPVEVQRSLTSAWLRWQNQHSPTIRSLSAAS